MPADLSASLALFAVAMLLGATFVRFDFGFSGAFRALLTHGDGRALAAACLIPAVVALAVVPLGGSGAYTRFVAPIGLPLVLGAALFGLGMQIANGCGSGTLVAAGQGSRRMWLALPCFCLGGVLGSLVQPEAARLPHLGPVDLPDLGGPAWGLAGTEILIALTALLLLRGARPAPRQMATALAIGLLAMLWFLLAREPWGITMGLTLWGARALQAAGLELRGFAFWADGWARHMLDAPLFSSVSALSDLGLLGGAALAAAATGRLRPGPPIGLRGALGAVLGGLAMGIGARLSYGCNVGAFIGGAASGSLHGLVWLAAALPGCWVGIRLRPRFGMPD